MVTKDYTRDELLTDYAKTMLEDRYWYADEKSTQDAFERVATQFADDEDHAQRLYDYSSKLWFGWATPVLSNGGTSRGLPISCFLSEVDDSRGGIGDHFIENIWLASMGGGIGTNWSRLRSDGVKTSQGSRSTGMIPFMHTVDSEILAINQGDCYLPGTEVLTSLGWVDFRDLKPEDKVAQVDYETQEVSYIEPKEIVVKDYSGDMYHISGGKSGNLIDLHVTPNHKMLVERLSKTKEGKNWKGILEKVSAEDVKYHRDNRHHTYAYATGDKLFSDMDRLMIAVQADAGIVVNRVTFHLKKERKITRLKDLLTRMGIEFDESPTPVGTVYIRFNKDVLINDKKDFSWINIQDINPEFVEGFVEELKHWDGSQNKDKGIAYTTSRKPDADQLQAILSVGGKRHTMRAVDREGNRVRQYQFYIYLEPKKVSGDCVTKTKYTYEGKVYCCEVETGILIVRYNNIVSLCGNTRRGGYASYLDISHPEILEFINMRKPTGGDPNRKNLNLHHGINIPDSFMFIIEKCVKDPSLDDSWDLIDPHTKEVVETVSALYLWGLILETRIETGEPYLHFIDTSNRLRPQAYKDADLEITQSNLCCVTGSTMVMTSKGEVSIWKLAALGKEVDIWNGKEWSKVLPQKTREDEAIYEIVVEVYVDCVYRPNGIIKETRKLHCSYNHKFYIDEGDCDTIRIIKKDAKDLIVGDMLEDWVCPITNDTLYGKVVSALKLEATEDMYCFKEHKRSRGMFNGIVTGNSEILIPTDPETTAVCCLSSVNLEKYDEWKDTDMVRDLIRMLDNVLDYFIENAPKEMHKAIKGATRGRDIGLGAMGFHAYLQSKGIPFESAMASSRNRVMFEDIYTKAKDASYELAIEKDSCPVIKECSFSIPAQRNIQLMAIAPNASSSIICGGTSPSVEPFSANMYTEKTQNGSNVKRNKFLDLTEEQWKAVSAAKGSVQGLDLDEDTKDTFKTAFEIDQHWIIDHAASRQPFICQSQSINLFFAADCSKEYLHSVHFSAWKKGLKTLYYCRSQVVDRAEDINKRFDRFDYKVPENNECLSCEG